VRTWIDDGISWLWEGEEARVRGFIEECRLWPRKSTMLCVKVRKKAGIAIKIFGPPSVVFNLSSEGCFDQSYCRGASVLFD